MTLRTNIYILTCISVFMSIVSEASPNSGQIPTYVIDSTVDVLSLTDTLSYFVDATTRLTKAEVEGQEFSLTTEVPILNSRENFWFRFSLINRDSNELKVYLCDDWHERKTYHVNERVIEVGQGAPRNHESKNGCIELILESLKQNNVYIKHWNLWDTKKATKLELGLEGFLKSYRKFKIGKYDLTVKSTISLLFFMSLLALIFFLIFKEKYLGYYFLYIVTFLFFYSKNRFFIDLLRFDKILGINLTYLIFPFYLLFLKHLLETYRTNKVLDAIINVVVLTSFLFLAVTIVIQILYDVELSYFIYNVYRILMFLLIIVSIYLLLKYNKSKITYIICFGTLFILVPIFSTFLAHVFYFSQSHAGYFFKVLKTPWGFSYYMLHARVGVVVEIIFFSFAIAIYLKQKANDANLIAEQNRELRLVGEDILTRKSLSTSGFSADLIKYIQTHKEDAIKIEDLMAHFGLGRTSLIEKIKQETNETPIQFVNFIKLSLAKEELLTTSKSIKELAYEFGYSTPAYFSKVFKAQFGKTPKDLRIKY